MGRSVPDKDWSLESFTGTVDTLPGILPISRKVNAQGDQIVEIEIDHDGNIEYPVNLPVRQIHHSDLLNVSNEHNYAAMFSQLQDEGWGTPPVVSPRLGGVSISELDSQENISKGHVGQDQGQGYTEVDFDPSLPQEWVNGEFTRSVGPPPSSEYADRTSFVELVDAGNIIKERDPFGIQQPTLGPPPLAIDYGVLLGTLDKGMHLWRCKLCGRLYTRRASLLDHINIHQGYRPYRCNACGSRFFYKNAYTRHVKLGCS